MAAASARGRPGKPVVLQLQLLQPCGITGEHDFTDSTALVGSKWGLRSRRMHGIIHVITLDGTPGSVVPHGAPYNNTCLQGMALPECPAEAANEAPSASAERGV